MKAKKEQMPFSWDNITIGQCDKMMAIDEMKCDDTDKCVRYLSIITGNDEDYYLSMPLPKLQKEVDRLGFQSDAIKPPEPRFTSGKYKVGDMKLILTASSQTMTAGQFIDYQAVLEANPYDIAMLCAIMLVPKGCTYKNGYDIFDLRQKLYDHFPIVDALGISVFYQKTYDVLSATVLNSSRKALSKEMKKHENKRDPEKIKVLREAIAMIETAESIVSGENQ